MAQINEMFDKPLVVSRAERVMELCAAKDYHYQEFNIDDMSSVVTLEFDNEQVIIDEGETVTIITQSEVIYEKWDHFVLRLMMA